MEVLVGVEVESETDAVEAGCRGDRRLADLSLNHKRLLFNLIVFFDDVLAWAITARLQGLAKLNHEFGVDGVSPGELQGEALVALLLFRLLKVEVNLEHLQKVLEKEV